MCRTGHSSAQGTEASPPHGAAVTETGPLGKSGDGWNITENLLNLNEIL
ncbi:hypothetical protein FHT76_003301 [Rhizobium sp. BK176]|nr:hypothetical protein [Rhizobium sp. BK399]MCS3738522.1 hypothetical protein [Rhizobium sp. BK661]MCS4091642.1 hypothetical protein [Rhizobium sp. BK176]